MSGGARTVLLVEDDELVRKLVGRILGAAGYRVLVASNGEEACSTLVRHDGRIDLLLTDVVLSGINGQRLAEGVVRCRPEMRVLLMSGYSNVELGRRGIPPGVELIEKPFRPEELLRAVRSTLSTPIPEPRRRRAQRVLDDAPQVAPHDG